MHLSLNFILRRGREDIIYVGRKSYRFSKETKNGAVDSEHGASKGGRSLLLTKSHHYKKEGYLLTFTKTTHAINIMYMLPYCTSKKYIFSLLQGKNTPLDRDLDHGFILGLMDCRVAKNSCPLIPWAKSPKIKLLFSHLLENEVVSPPPPA